MGLVFYLFLGSIILTVIRLFGGRRLAEIGFMLLVIVSATLCGWGVNEARWPQVKELTVATKKLPAGVDELTIAGA